MAMKIFNGESTIRYSNKLQKFMNNKAFHDSVFVHSLRQKL